MPTDIESAVRSDFARIMPEIAPEALELDADLVADYGLSCMNKVVFLISACESSGVSLASFTEADLATLRTLGEVTTALSARRQQTESGVAS